MATDPARFASFEALLLGADTPERRPGWMTSAACAHADDVEFFLPPQRSTKPARQVCRCCPVLDQCAAYVATFKPDVLHGVWAGTSRAERLRRRHPNAA